MIPPTECPVCYPSYRNNLPLEWKPIIDITRQESTKKLSEYAQFHLKNAIVVSVARFARECPEIKWS